MPKVTRHTPGQIGRFSFTLGGNAPYGEYTQTFGLVEEGITWFGDAGGPADDQLSIRVEIVEALTPPVGTSIDPPMPETTTGDSASGTSEPTTTGAPDPGDMSSGTSGSTGAQDSAGPPQTGAANEGCSCRSAPQDGPRRALLALLGLLGLRRRRRRRT